MPERKPHTQTSDGPMVKQKAANRNIIWICITHEVLKDFKTQTVHLIVVRRPDLVGIKKVSSRTFCCFKKPKVKMKENWTTEKYMDLAREQKNQWNIKTYVIPIIDGILWTCKRDWRN